MKSPERKIKQEMPFEEIPVYLRRLADALEKKTEALPEELKDLPEPVAKLEIKGKAYGADWVVKIKIKAKASPDPEMETAATVETVPAHQTAKPTIKYKDLKKRMKTSFEAIGESLTAQRMPESDVFNSFLADSDLMMAFTGEKYGEAFYSDYQKACHRLAEAYVAKGWEGFKSAYAELEQLKKKCHKEYK